MKYYESKNGVKYRRDQRKRKAFKMTPNGKEVEIKLPNEWYADAIAYGSEISKQEYQAS